MKNSSPNRGVLLRQQRASAESAVACLLFAVHGSGFSIYYSRFSLHNASATPPLLRWGKRSHHLPHLYLILWDGSAMTEPDEQRPASVPTAELNALIADYEAKIDEVAELITRVRHEMNNPLTGVLGQAQLLLREDLNERARKRAETIEELAIRLRDIVAQLRQVQRPPKKPQV
jgi:signal transduction histidine kinase